MCNENICQDGEKKGERNEVIFLNSNSDKVLTNLSTVVGSPQLVVESVALLAGHGV